MCIYITVTVVYIIFSKEDQNFKCLFAYSGGLQAHVLVKTPSVTFMILNILIFLHFFREHENCVHTSLPFSWLEKFGSTHTCA